ncbi:MAG TPA: carboxylating nicotinate-nucleotide diphosphorylase [Candidatus Polarisedimenticolia bacterium]|nr:carboxylating nicotinate-nucleotide diphosphorylase [Candidatus Polarisedimenticolia bacterium]
MPAPPAHLIARLARQALLEDLGPGDLTTGALAPAGRRAWGRIEAGAALVAAGLEPARAAFLALDPAARFPSAAGRGEEVPPGGTLLAVEADAGAILSAERTALNFLGRLCGIATLARRCVREAGAAGTRAGVYATRKTTPGLRWLEKDAAEAGGARRHREGLWDAVLIKDNHLALGYGPAEAVARARAWAGHGVAVEVEVDTLEHLDEALASGADVILLDNMPLEAMREAVRRAETLTGRRPALEASGGITLQTVREVAATGVDRISIGALTHSAPAAPLSLILSMLP